MEIASKTLGKQTIVSVSGRLDATTARELEEFCSNLISEGSRRLILCFEELESIDSDGLRAVVSAANKIAFRRGRIALCCLSKPVMEVIHQSGFDELFPVYRDTDAALRGT